MKKYSKGTQYKCPPGKYRDGQGNLLDIPVPLPQNWVCLPGVYVGPRKFPDGMYQAEHGEIVPLPTPIPEGWVVVPGVYAGPERRKKPTPMFSRYLFWGRRQNPVHLDDAEGFTDRIYPHAWRFFRAVFLLSTVDAGFSIYHIVFGHFQEANPVLNPLINHSPWLFLLGKYFLTVFGILFLIVHQHFRIFKVVTGLAIALYSALCVYHVVLLFA